MDLLQYSYNKYSQFGQDGIIEQIFNIIGLPKSRIPTSVEFGAWDGLFASNTCLLLREKGWQCLFIEPDKKRFSSLEKNHGKEKNAILINKFIQLKEPGTLDDILLEAKLIPEDFELLSIDIDSCDYYIWESLKNYHPKVVIIEFNPTIPVDYEYIQPPDFNIHDEHSLCSLVKLGKDKGYELICCTETDGIFVKRELFPLFNITDNSPEKLFSRFKYQYQTSLWQGGDGTLHLIGNNRLLWHNVFINESKLQVIPKFLRFFPGNTHPILQNFKRLYYTFPIISKIINFILGGGRRPPHIHTDTSHL